MNMEQSPYKDSQGGFDLRRIAVIAIVGLLLFSAVAGALVGSTGIAAAQQGGGGDGKQGPGGSKKSADETITKQDFRQWLNSLQKMSPSKGRQEVASHKELFDILVRVYKRVKSPGMPSSQLAAMIKRDPGKAVTKLEKATKGPVPVPNLPSEKSGSGGNGGGGKAGSGSGGGSSSGGNSGGGKAESGSGGGGTTTPAAVKKTISKFKKQNLGYKSLPRQKKKKAKSILRKLGKDSISKKKQENLVKNLSRVFAVGNRGIVNREAREQRHQIINKTLGVKAHDLYTVGAGEALPDINIPSILDIKLKSLASSFMDAVGDLLTDVYTLIFDTPVPVNSGWHQILGYPTNGAFETLYTALMEERLYPVMRILLGIALIFLAGAVALPQFRQRNRIVDLLINLVGGITLFSFAWPVATFMHGITDDITMWILPNTSEVASSATNLISMGGAPVAMYLFGAGGLFSTLFVLGLEVGLRRVLLVYLLPYLLGPVLLIRFVSPWGRLRSYASMFLWQYVNVLAMVIPLSIIMRAIIAIKWNIGVSGFGAVLVIIALFLVMIAIPIVSTWFFLQVPGKVNQKVQSVASGARKRMPSARGAFGGARSAVNTTATGGRAVHSRAKSMVGAARTARPSLPSLPVGGSASDTATDTSATDSSGSDTTAGEIRDHYDEQNSDPMSGERQKSAYMRYHTGVDALPTSGNIER